MNTLPFPVGTKTDADYNDLVGQTFQYGGKTVRLCKTATAVSSPASKYALATVTGGAYSFKKTTVSGSASATNLAGVIDPDLDSNLSANDFFWVYCGKGDRVMAILDGASVSAGDILGTVTTAGQLGTIGSGTAAATVSNIGDTIAAAAAKAIGTVTSAGTALVELLGPC
jgi:hypothetical protein